jgi:hypothetical protein
VIRRSPSSQESIEGDSPQSNHHLHAIYEPKLAHQISSTVLELAGVRFVSGRGTPHYSGDIRIDEKKPVVAVVRLGLARETETVERLIQPIARTVSGKHPSGTVGTMCGRSKAHDEQSSPRASESGDRFAPIGLIGEPFCLDGLNVLSVFNQTGAHPAIHDLTSELRQTLRGRRRGGLHHPSTLGQ